MDIKLLVLDIDGTIAGKSNQVSDTVIKAIEAVQTKGISVALATGRMYNSALRFHQSIKSELPITAYNGAWIQNPITGKRHKHLPLSPSLALELLNCFEQPQWQSLLGVHIYVDDQLFVTEITPETEDYADRSGISPIAVNNLRNLLDQQPTKMLALCQNPQVVAQLLTIMGQRYHEEEVYLTQSTETFFEVTNPYANKGNAIKYLAEEMLGLQPNQVMAIGDNFNDTKMLEYAGFSVAMGNAPEPVKQLADWVAPDVEEDGVAVAIAKFILGNGD